MLLIDIICDHLTAKIENNELSNEDLIKLIEHIGGYLNLQTIPDYCKENGISYNGAKKFRTIRKIFNVRFVVDNT